MTARIRGLAIAIVLATSVFVALSVHARWLEARAAGRSPRNVALVRAIGLGDLALSSSARWLRHPSQAEPAAAVQDVPAGLDVDPAGALIVRPRSP